ncbi:DUF2716 domain-containing protein [Bremerella cremea]|uniref:DUF2716 domain-containing protein n=1 Tax=Bremerella cremea TaxID=1031537 RepID=UPI0031E53FBF
MNAWSEFTDDEYAEIWDRFYAEFKFKPDYFERFQPAIDEPRPSVTFDLSGDLSEELLSEIDELLLESFRTLTPKGQRMIWLDWQHTCYRFDPDATDGSRPFHWYPDGDYYVFLADDFSFGTFGHPWQASLCVFGSSLLNRVEPVLRGKLPVLRESPGDDVAG